MATLYLNSTKLIKIQESSLPDNVLAVILNKKEDGSFEYFHSEDVHEKSVESFLAFYGAKPCDGDLILQ
jgi:hypothetical protein